MGNNKALALRPEQPITDITTCRSLFTGFLPDIEKAIQGKMSPDVLMSAMVNSVRKNPKLLKCSQGSMLSALLYCADTGLVPDTPSQECHLIPFKNQVVWVPGYRGLAKKVRQSGEIVDLETRVVYEQDSFVYNYGLEPRLDHIPFEDPENRGESIYFYAIARFRDQNIPAKFEVMPRLDVEAIRRKAPGGDKDAWTNHFDEMGRKTVLRRLCKLLPMTAELATVIDLDNAAAIGKSQPVHEVVAEVIDEASDKRSPTEKLADQVDEQADNGSPSKPELAAEITALEDSRNLGTGVPDLRMEHVGYLDLEHDEVGIDKLTAYRDYLKGLDDKE